VGSPIGPKGPPRFPKRPKDFVVRHSVLDDEGLDSVRMGEGHAKAHGPPIVLHVKRVAGKPERVGEVIHDDGEIIERVGEFRSGWPVAVPKSRVIRRDKVITVGEPGEQGFEHPRRRGKSVQKEKRWRVFRAGFSVEDGEPIYLYRAIEGR